MKRIILSRNFKQRGLFRNIITEMKPTLKEDYVAKMNVSGNNRDILLNNNWYTIGEDTILIDIPESSLLKIPIESLLGIYDEPTYILAHSRNIEGRPAAESSVFVEYDDKAVYYFNHTNPDVAVRMFGMNRLPSDAFENVFDALFIIKKYKKSDNTIENDELLIENLMKLNKIKLFIDEFINRHRVNIDTQIDFFIRILANGYTV